MYKCICAVQTIVQGLTVCFNWICKDLPLTVVHVNWDSFIFIDVRICPWQKLICALRVLIFTPVLFRTITNRRESHCGFWEIFQDGGGVLTHQAFS